MTAAGAGPGPEDPPPPTDVAEASPAGGNTSPETRKFCALVAAATHAITGIEELVDPEVLGDWHAAQHRIQLKSMRTRLRTLAGIFADADSAHRPR